MLGREFHRCHRLSAWFTQCSVPAGCGRPGAGCVRGSSPVPHSLVSVDSLASWTGPQTHNQNQRLAWTHRQTLPAAEDKSVQTPRIKTEYSCCYKHEQILFLVPVTTREQTVTECSAFHFTLTKTAGTETSVGPASKKL